uniref:3-oxo-5-alpha-steroid 4-dehydrogenase C-terminal domain-containing protein n=1 Tax=Salix viminalis TaxID=40686 RepID=A0A6N2M2L5_SALVM
MAAFLEQTFFHYALLSFYLLGPPTFIALRFFQFPYGKHNRVGWGPTISPPLAWFIMESPTILLPLILLPSGQHFKTSKALLLMSPFLLHYFHRTIFYPLRIYQSTSKQNTKTTIGFPVFLTVNGFLNQALNTYLQSENGGYKVPRGGWFEVVTCPNYLGEIVEWLGWAVMTWSWGGLGFFLYTCSNLVPRACASHKWYLEKFGEDYPKKKRSSDPFHRLIFVRIA